MSFVAQILDSVVPVQVGNRTAFVVIAKGILYTLSLLGVPIPAELEINGALDALIAAFAVAHVVR